MKICMAGQGAFGIKHLEAIRNIPGIEVVTLAGGSPDSTAEVAKQFNIPHWSTDLGECLARPGVEAAMSSSSETPRRLSCSAVNAVTTTGMSCTDSSRLRAVTTISSSVAWAMASPATLAAKPAVTPQMARRSFGLRMLFIVSPE